MTSDQLVAFTFDGNTILWLNKFTLWRVL